MKIMTASLLIFMMVSFCINAKAHHEYKLYSEDRLYSQAMGLEKSSLEEPIQEAEGEFRELIDAGPDKYTIKCKQNPQAVCYEYNTDDNWIRLCDGSGTMIGYVTSVEYMGNYEDPSTGDIIDIYEVQTGTD